MEALILYSIAVTVGFIVTLVMMINAKRRSNFLLKKIKEMKREALAQQGQVPVNVQPSQQIFVPQQSVQPQQVFLPTQPVVQPVQYQPQQQVMMQPQMAQPQPVQQARPQKKESKFNALSLVFGVGVLLLIISAAVFISATWATLAPAGKCALLFSVVAVVYGMSALTGKKLKLEGTSSALYLLGSLLIPVAITGTYLSFKFEQVPILLALCSLSLLITGYLGYKIFKAKYHVGVSYFGFVWSVTFILTQIMGYSKGMPLGLAVAALVTAAVYFKWPKSRFAGVLAEIAMWADAIVLFAAVLILMDHKIEMTVTIAMICVTYMLMIGRRGFYKFIAPIVIGIGICPVLSIFLVDLEDSKITILAVVEALVFAAYLAAFKLLKKDNPLSNLAAVVVPLIILGVGDTDVRLAVVSFIAAVAVLFLSGTKLEKDMYWAAIALNAGLLVASVDKLYLGGISLVLFIAAVAFSIMRKKITPSIAFGALLIAGVISGSSYMTKRPMAITMVCLLTALYVGLIIWDRLKKTDDRLYNASYLTTRIVTMVMLAVPMGVLLGDLYSKNAMFSLVIFAISAAVVAITCFDRDNYVSPVGVVYMGVSIKLLIDHVGKITESKTVPFIILMVAVVGMAFAGRFICRSVFSRRKIDMLTIAAGVLIVVSGMDPWMILALIAAFILTFIGRFSKASFKPILAAVVYVAALAIAVVDIKYPEIAALEIRLGIVLAGALLVFLFIRMEKVSKLLWFFTVALLIHIEMLYALIDGGLLQLSIIMISALIIFLYSFLSKTKSWFILGLACITEAGLGFSITYWESKLWWIYLLVEGAIMIALASANEYKKRKAHEQGLEEKKVMIFSGWKW